MTYKEIIDEIAINMKPENKWWPRFFFHYTDVNIAVGIIEEGYLYSRNKAIEKKLMESDNASSDVISRTNSETFDYARLYFRPKTPTQYRNEGYRPPILRDSWTKASCPVPIFFLFNAEAILDSEKVFFAEKGMAGAGHQKCSGVDSYSQLNFSRIYHNDWYDKESDPDIKDYRQSEVLLRDKLRLDNNLYRILCRSEAERETLLFLLKKRSDDLYEKYKGLIQYSSKADLFYNNGIFVKEVNWSGSVVSINFNDQFQRDRRSAEINVQIILTQIDAKCIPVDEQMIERTIDFYSAAGLELPIQISAVTDRMYVRVLFDDALMYDNCIKRQNRVVIL